MATFAKPTTGKPSIGSLLTPPASQFTGLYAGEDLDAFDPCYIKTDGKVWRSSGASANAAAKVYGYPPQALKTGDAVTLIAGLEVGWANSAALGAPLYLGATAGVIADAVSTGGTAPIGFVIDATRVYLDRSAY